jgi:hypothetical protein
VGAGIYSRTKRFVKLPKRFESAVSGGRSRLTPPLAGVCRL